MSATLKAIKRENLTRSNTKRLRDSGQVPGVVYGKQKEPQTIAVDGVELVKVIRDNGKNAVLTLNLDSGNTADVMFYDYQVDPLKDHLVHVDFYMANMSEARDVSVPLRLEGEPSGKGVLQQPLFEVQVRAKPNDIPEEITVDISNLEIGDSIKITDLPVNSKFEFIDDSESTIVTVLAPDTGVAEEHSEEVEESEEAAKEVQDE